MFIRLFSVSEKHMVDLTEWKLLMTGKQATYGILKYLENTIHFAPILLSPLAFFIFLRENDGTKLIFLCSYLLR